MNEKINHLKNRIKTLKGNIEDITEDLEHNPIAGAVGMGYVLASQQEAKSDDTSS